MTSQNYTLEVHDEDDGDLWARFLELPGCFASGRDLDELLKAAAEAIGLYLSDTTVRLVAEHPLIPATRVRRSISWSIAVGSSRQARKMHAKCGIRHTK